MAHHLVLRIGLHDRFHGLAFGAPEWPPAPARAFQALLAGAARGRSVAEPSLRALRWLEQLPPPRIGTPHSKLGAEQTVFVPNNDLDSKGGDPARLAEVRVAKRVVPRIVDASTPILFVWSWNDGDDDARVVLDMADQLYQFGRGVDAAWARAEILDDGAVESLLTSYAGAIHSPATDEEGRGGTLCPTRGSLDSLLRRFQARRIREDFAGGKRSELYENPPKPLFRLVRYDKSKRLVAYDLAHETESDRAYPLSLARAPSLVESLRDAAAAKLAAALPDKVREVERVVAGRKLPEEPAIANRLRLIPLPSVGHEHADLAIRRIVLELPDDTTIATEDLLWAFDNLTPIDPSTGEVGPYLLTRAPSGSPMLARYAARSACFRSVTPLVLPEAAGRRRIEPTRRAAEAKGGAERVAEEARATAAVRTALRHAGVSAMVESIMVQREPFERRGSRAEPFAEGTRFSKHRLWHAEITFACPVQGPLVIGDGRFLGLGVMSPARATTDAYVFHIDDGLLPGADPIVVTRALRRAVMSLAQSALGSRALLPSFFTGHERDGTPLRGNRDGHLTFALIPSAALLIIPPHATQRRAPWASEREHLAILDDALPQRWELRAGAAGLLTLRRVPTDAVGAGVFEPSRSWRSVTPYVVTRHAKRLGAEEALAADVRRECDRRGLPHPRVTPGATRGIPRVGLVGEPEIEFATAVQGPILLGRTRHFGGGLFLATTRKEGVER